MGLARHSLAALICCIAWPLCALDLTLPSGVSETASRDRTLAQEAVPEGPFENGNLPVRMFEGSVSSRAYRIPSSGLTPLQILSPLRAQLTEADYEVLLDCDQTICGGFDFRFALDVLPAPNMYVNIRDYHFLSAVSPDGEAAVTLLASAAAGAGYLQIVQIGTSASIATPRRVETQSDTATNDSTLASRLLTDGSAILRSLEFQVGKTTLNGADVPELAQIAALMNERPGLRIAVVGHTDTMGGLEANIAVSRARAESVRQALINRYGVASDRIEANGMGYLAPVSSNLTAEGREANRRVEVMVVAEDQ